MATREARSPFTAATAPALVKSGRANSGHKPVIDDVLTFALVLLGCALGASVANDWLTVDGIGVVFFAPAGITAAALLISPRRRWPLIIAATLVADLVITHDHGHGLAASIGLASAHGVGPLVGALIATSRRGRINLNHRADLVAFLVGPVVVGPIVGAFIGALTSTTLGDPFGRPLLSWWLDEGLATLLIGALIVTHVTSPINTAFVSPAGLGGVLIVAASSILLFELTVLPLGFLVILPVATVSARYGVRAATTASFVVGVIAIATWVSADPSLAGLSGTESLITIQLQLVAVSGAALLVAVESSQRDLASREAADQHEHVRLLRAALSPEEVVIGRHVHAEGISTSASDRLDVGGDWYDVAETPDGLVRILIGDVTGHGTGAVVPMGQLKFAASAFTTLTTNPAQLLDWLDAYACRPTTKIFATAFCAVYDPVEQRLTYTSAGHPPPLISGTDGTWSWLSGARSPLLGLGRRGARRSKTITLDGPCTLVVYTDGVVERPGEIIDVGLERMYDTVTHNPAQSVNELVDRLQIQSGRDDASFVRIQLTP